MAAGDIKNNVKQLQVELKAIKYTQSLDAEAVASGSPKFYLPIYHYLFTSYNTKLNKDIINSNNELYGKSDMRFMEAVYRILRDKFNHKPKISRDQFFAPGFAEWKVIMATDIIRTVKSRFEPPKSGTFRVASAKFQTSGGASEKVEEEPVEMPRKVAQPNAKWSQKLAGAIVLPSTSGGFKIPKSLKDQNNLKEPRGLPVHQERKLHSTKSYNRQRETYRQDSGDNPEIVDVEATEPSAKEFATVTSNKHEIDDRVESLVRRKVVDLVSPALTNLSERIKTLEFSVESIESTPRPSEKSSSPPSSSLTAGLVDQMRDFSFKLDTLTSRITLIENRVTMLEARVEGEVLLRKQSDGQSSSSVRASEAPSLRDGGVQRSPERLTNGDDGMATEYLQDPPTLLSKPTDDGDILRRKVIREENNSNEILGTGKTVPSTNESSEQENGVEWASSNTRLEIAAAKPEASAYDREETRLHADSGKNHRFLSFMERLVNPNDSSIQHDTIDTSAISIPCASYDDDTKDRRSSTPINLDTSTLERINRIGRMIDETKGCFHQI